MDISQPRIRGGSFSRLVVYEACPYRAYLEFAVKEPGPERPADDPGLVASARGQVIHTAAEGFIRGRDELHVELRRSKVKAKLEELRDLYGRGVVSVEEDWAYTAEWGKTSWLAEDVWLRVKLDAGVTGVDGGFEVVDHKSGKRYGNEVKHAQQGLLYGVSAIMRFPEVERVKITFLYTDLNDVWSREFDRATLARLVPSWTERLNAMLAASTFKPKPSKINCRFCPYRPVVSGGTGKCAHGVETEPLKRKK